MELHKANLEAAQPMVPNPNLALNQFMTQVHPFYPGCLPAGQNQMSYGALMASQQAQLAQQPQQSVPQPIVTPISTAMQTPAVSLASNILQQQQQQHATSQQQQQQLMNSLAGSNKNTISAIPGSNYFVNGTNGAMVNNVMSVNNLAAALPIAYFLTKPSAVAAAVAAAAVSQSGGQSCSSSCTGTTTTVSSTTPYLNLANGGISSQQQAAAMLSLAAVQQQVAAASSHTSSTTSSSSSLNNSYHVTPKLKSPAGLLTVSSGRGTDKFSPY